VDQFAADALGGDPEAIAYQITATREFLHDIYPITPEVTNLREIVRVAEAAQQLLDQRMLFAPLLAFAFMLEEELRLEEALDVLETAGRLSDGRDGEEELATGLQLARVLRLSGQFGEARDAYAAAGRIAVRMADTHSALLSRIGRGIVLQKLGNLPESERTLREVVADARLVGDRDIEARALQDLAGTLRLSGRTQQAIPLAFRAFQLFEAPLHRLRALSDTGLLLKELGLHQAAKHAFSVVMSGQLSREVRLRAIAELVELGAMTGDRVTFERWRRELSGSYDDLPPEDQVDYELKVGTGLATFGHRSQAEKHLQRAIDLAEQHRLNERLFTAESMLKELCECRDHEKEDAAPDDDEISVEPQLQSTLASLVTLESAT
jgi:tetratricopeptide (TPR) repeat protein